MINSIDISIVSLYLLLCLALGMYKASSIKNIEEYTLGKGNFSNIVMIGTLFGTGISSSTTMGGVGAIYSLNIIYIIATLFKPIGWMLAGIIYSRKNKLRNCLTLPDVMDKFYGSEIKHIVTVCVVITSIGFLAVQITAIANIINYFGMGYSYGVIICTFILISYSALGGVQAVAFTDLLQFFIFFLIFPIVCIKGVSNIGGANVFLDSISKIDFNFNLKPTDYIALAGMSLYFIPSEAPFVGLLNNY